MSDRENRYLYMADKNVIHIMDSREYVDLVVYTLKKKNPIITNILQYITIYLYENVENIKGNDFYFFFFFFSVSFQDSFPINLPFTDYKKRISFKEFETVQRKKQTERSDQKSVLIGSK